MNCSATYNHFIRSASVQGTDESPLKNTKMMESFPDEEVILAENSGWIESIEPGTIDNVALRVGAGRLAQNSLIDYPAEIVLYHRVGDNFEAVDPLAALHYTNGVLK